MRIDIVGLPASGKSYLASAIAKKFSIPHIHLDRFWFESGGTKGTSTTPNLADVRARVKEKVCAVIQDESWVSDGVYLHVQGELATRADIIIFLDIPTWKRVLNHAGRLILQRIHLSPVRHKEVTFLDDIRFFAEVVGCAKTRGPKLRAFVEEYKDKVVILKSRREVEQYLAQLH